MKFLENPYFLQFGVPLITVGLSIFIKYVTRNDKYTGFKKEDLAVGLDLAVTALLIFITASTQLAKASSQSPKIVEQLASVPWVLMAFLVGIWGISTVVRKLGWESDEKLKWGWGIIFPGAFGLFTLLFVVNWIS